MVVINFSHPLTVAQVECIEALTGEKVEQVIEARAPADHTQPFTGQAGVVRELA